MNKTNIDDIVCDSDATDSQLFHADPCVSDCESSLSSQADFPNTCRGKNINYRSNRCSYNPYQPPLGLPSGYSPQTPFPSQTEMCMSTLEPHDRDQPRLSSLGSSSMECPSGNLSSCLVSGNYCSYPGDSCYSCSPDGHSQGDSSQGDSSLEQPRSLRSIPTAFAPHGCYMPPHACSPHGPPCYSRYPPDASRMDQGSHHRQHYHTPCWPSCKSSLDFTWVFYLELVEIVIIIEKLRYHA